MTKPPELTATSYAILGLLAVQPWSTYELAQQMERALGRFWPRARSKLYEEPKKLVAHGLAKAATETVGKRARTNYSITAKGRRALAAWVPTPGSGPQLEFEQLIKVFFAEHGTKADLLRTLEDVRAGVREQVLESQSIPTDYLEGRGSFPQRLPWLILTGRLLHDFQTMLDEWAQWAIGVVEAWPDDLRKAEPDWKSLEAMAALADSLRQP
jgi:DNA-binding PadR family transcriptional regulator